MLSRIVKNYQITPGEKGLLLSYLGVAAFGAGLAFSIVAHLSENVPVPHTLTPYHLWILMSGAIGALSGFHLNQQWIGGPGLLGLGRALVGAILTCIIGALIGGTLALPFYGTMFGPFFLLSTFISLPILLPFWLLALVAAHFLVAAWRNERESIFRVRFRLYGRAA